MSDRARAEALAETKAGTRFDRPLTDAQRRKYLRRDGSLVIRAEGRAGDDVTAHVERVRDE